MKNIKIYETFIDVTRDIGVGETGIYETKFKSKEALLKSFLKTHGKLVHTLDLGCSQCLQNGSVGVKSASCGWVFQRETTYEDCSEIYLQEIWVVMSKQCEVCGDNLVTRRIQSGKGK